MAAYHRVYDYVTCRLTVFCREQFWAQRSFLVRVTFAFTFIVYDTDVVGSAGQCMLADRDSCSWRPGRHT